VRRAAVVPGRMVKAKLTKKRMPCTITRLVPERELYFQNVPFCTNLKISSYVAHRKRNKPMVYRNELRSTGNTNNRKSIAKPNPGERGSLVVDPARSVRLRARTAKLRSSENADLAKVAVRKNFAGPGITSRLGRSVFYRRRCPFSAWLCRSDRSGRDPAGHDRPSPHILAVAAVASSPSRRKPATRPGRNGERAAAPVRGLRFPRPALRFGGSLG